MSCIAAHLLWHRRNILSICNVLYYPKATSLLSLVVLSLAKVTVECAQRTTVRFHYKHFLWCK